MFSSFVESGGKGGEISSGKRNLKILFFKLLVIKVVLQNTKLMLFPRYKRRLGK